MDEKLYLTDLNCYARADEKQKKNPIVLILVCFQQKDFKKNFVHLLRIEVDNVHWER